MLLGVTGAYPNVTFPLAGSDATADLDTATFNAKIKSATAFEWFDSAGARYTGTGDIDITATSIKSGIDIFGTTGTYGPNCTADGQTDCVTTNTYKSVDTLAFNAWDIRQGQTLGGVAGLLNSYRNMANLTTFNRTTGTAAVTGATVDNYDSIDDANNGGAFPILPVAGLLAATGANWLRDSVSDTGIGGGTASNGACEGTEDCVYQDRVTKLYYAKASTSIYTWESAITICENLTYGTYTDWRIPSQKGIMQAYSDGIWSLAAAGKLNLQSGTYWSASTDSVSAAA
ncbi:MAG: hypothetical protein AAB834_03185, partial [Patescibacteria group bacterium]